MLVGINESLLRGVLRVIRIPENVTGGSQDRVTVTGDNLRKCGPLTGEGTADKLIVGKAAVFCRVRHNAFPFGCFA